MKQRSLLTLAGATLILIYFVVAAQSGWRGASESFFANICARAGLVVLAMALAWPQLVPFGRKFPPWFWGTVAVALMVVVVRPRLAPLAIGLVVAGSLINGGIGWIKKNLRAK